MLKSIFKFSFFTVLSKGFGFLRDVALVGALGVGPLSDAFFVAFRLPNLLRAILADGALNMVFTPLYTQKREGGDSQKALGFFINNIFTVLAIVTIAICAIGILCMPLLIVIFAPGIDIDSTYFASASRAASIMFPYLFFAAFSALLSGVLQADNKFFFVSFSPIILNVAMTIAAFGSIISHSTTTIAWSVCIAGLLQCVIGMVCVRIQSGYFVHPVVPKPDVDLKTFFNRIAPAAIGSCATRLSIWIDTVIASTVPNAVSYIYYADRLYQIPRSLVGVAISYVMLPELAKAVKNEDGARTHLLLNRALEMGFALCIPAATGLAILSTKASDILLMYGGLAGQEHSQAIARVLMCFAIAIPAVTSVSILNTMFFASGDTSVPVKVSFWSVGINAICNIILIRYVGYLSVPIATSIGSWVNFAMLCSFVRKRYNFTIDSRFSYKVGMSCVAAFVMSMVVCVTEVLLDQWIGYYVPTIIILLILCGVGVISYMLTLKLTKTYSTVDIINMFDSV